VLRGPKGYTRGVPDTPEQMQEKLDDLGETIDAARRQAEQDDLLPGPEPEPLFQQWGVAPEDYEPNDEPDDPDEDPDA
jgi:hypothetical protein